MRQEPPRSVVAWWPGKTISLRTPEGLESELYLVSIENLVVKCFDCKSDTSRTVVRKGNLAEVYG